MSRLPIDARVTPARHHRARATRIPAFADDVGIREAPQRRPHAGTGMSKSASWITVTRVQRRRAPEAEHRFVAAQEKRRRSRRGIACRSGASIVCGRRDAKQRAQAWQVVARDLREQVVLEVIVLVQQQERHDRIASDDREASSGRRPSVSACCASARTAEM